MRLLHCSCALALALLATPAAAQAPAGPQTRGYTVFLNGAAVGVENVQVEVGDDGLVITSQGRLEPPIDMSLRLAEVRYAPDGTPRSLAVESMVEDEPSLLETVFDNGVARSTGIEGPADAPVDIDRTDLISLRPVVLAAGFFGAYEAVTRRLVGADVGTEVRAYMAPQAEVTLRVTAVADETIQTPNSTLTLRRYELAVVDPSGEVPMSVVAAEDGGLARLDVPGQGLQVVRSDLTSPLTRRVAFSNPGDERASIPAAGFSLGATLTLPEDAAAPHPAVILVAGVPDRDGTLDGVPVLAYVAGALADAGIASVRYDRRGTGLSGGRSESADLEDHAGDIETVFEWLEDRADIDDDRIAVLGIDEGAWMVLQAGADEDDFAAVVTVRAASLRGADFILERQEQMLAASTLTPEEADGRRELQQRIHAAVLTGEGWDQVPEDLRRQADTPWFRSYLAFDPVEAVEDVRSPMLFISGADERSDTHARRLVEAARAEGAVTTIDAAAIDGMSDALGRSDDVSQGVHPELLATLTNWLVRILDP